MEFRPHSEGLCVVDFGSQYTQLIARKLREQQIYCECVLPSQSKPQFGFRVCGVILSGGPDTVFHENAQTLPSWVIDLKVPILGICYGMQLLVEYFGGRVVSGDQREYGPAQISRAAEFSVAPHQHASHSQWLWPGFDQPHQVWMSHGDHIESLPEGFVVIARSDRAVAACVSLDESCFIMGLQYHPEVHHTSHGSEFLAHYAQSICQVKIPWRPSSMISSLRESLIKQMNTASKDILVACSGGVDSTVTLVLLTQIFGKDRVKGVFINTGLLRLDDMRNIRAIGSDLQVDVEVLSKEDLFYQRLKGHDNPEQKRKIIGATFIDVFAEYSETHKDRFSHLAQGTLYSDVVESGGGSKRVIKTHHNVGGLPEVVPFELIEPLRYLFKDEVRALGQELGIADEILYQHPFPGPGLGVRIVGEVDVEKVKILQQSDKIFIDYLKQHDLYHQIWQAFCILLPVRSVGVMGDNRTYEWALSLRAVTSSDAMTAQVADLSMTQLSAVAEQIISSVSGINRVLYDVTTKPPATIEWE